MGFLEVLELNVSLQSKQLVVVGTLMPVKVLQKLRSFNLRIQLNMAALSSWAIRCMITMNG